MKRKRKKRRNRILLTALSAALAAGLSGGQVITAREENPQCIEIVETTESEKVPSSLASASIVHSGTIGTAEWTIDSNGVLTIGEGEYERTSMSSSWPWSSYLDEVREIDGTAHFIVSGNLYSVFSADTVVFFKPNAGEPSVTTIDLSGWDTSQVTDMSNMFSFQYSLQNLNISTLNTENVTTFDSMFALCTSLSELDLSNFDTSSCQNTSTMFWDCQAVKIHPRCSGTVKLSKYIHDVLGLSSLNRHQSVGF